MQRHQHRKLASTFALIFFLSWVWSCASDGLDSDQEAPTASSPLGGSTVVGTSNLTVTFSEAVQGASGNEADGLCDISKTIKLTSSDGSCYGMVIVAVGNTYTINPASDLVTGTYKLTLGTGITDAAGNALSETEISFTVDDALTTAIVNLTKDLGSSAGASDVIAAAKTAASAEGVTNDLKNMLPTAYEAIVTLAGFDFDSSLSTVITSLLGNISGNESVTTATSRSKAASDSDIGDVAKKFSKVSGKHVPAKNLKDAQKATTTEILSKVSPAAKAATFKDMIAEGSAGIQERAPEQISAEVYNAFNEASAEGAAGQADDTFTADEFETAFKEATTLQQETVPEALKAAVKAQADTAVASAKTTAVVKQQEAEAAAAITVAGTNETDGDTGSDATDDSTTDDSTTGGGATGGTSPSTCTFNGQTVTHGSSVTAYSSATVAYGSTCQSETRICSDGTLSGSFKHASCTVESPAMSGSVQTFGSSGSSRVIARSTASTGSTSVSVNQPVKSLVSLYLLVDENLKYPVAKIKSGADGSYNVAPSDVKNFLINLPSDNLSADYGYLLPDAAAGINNSSTDAQIIRAFEALGTLQVCALYVTDGKAKVISAMADPTSDDPARVDPIVQRIAQQVLSSMQETLKETITALAGLSDAKPSSRNY